MSESFNKFEGLKKESQHKKLYERIKKLHQKFDQRLFDQVQKMQLTIGEEPIASSDIEALSKSYHHHIKKSSRGVLEPDFLVTTKDKEKPSKEWLDIVIYLDQIRSAHNIGNILRTIEAFRLGRVCFSSDMANLNHLQVQKTSMGAYKHIIEESVDNLPRPIIAIETSKKAVPIQDFTFPEKFTLVMGNEEFGVSKKMLEQADHIVEVPLCGQKNSLNVAACFSILAHHIRASGS